MPRESKKYSFDYGFPLFVPDAPRSYLIKHEKIRVSDIWGFWDYLVKTHAHKRSPRQGQFLQSMLEQARYFFTAAGSAPIPQNDIHTFEEMWNWFEPLIKIEENN